MASRSSSWRGCWNSQHIVMRSQVLKMTWAKPSCPQSSGENEESYREHSNHSPEHVLQSSAICLSSWNLSSPPSSLLWGNTCLLCFVLIYSVLVMPISWAIRVNIWNLIYLSLFCFLDGNWRVWMMWEDIIFILSRKLFSSEFWRHFSCSLSRLRSFSFLSLCVCGLFLLSESLKSFLFLPILKCHNGMSWCGCISSVSGTPWSISFWLFVL